ncbi:MAG: Gfo/Idh/MocA family protein [Hyphomicrobiales bacterium]
MGFGKMPEKSLRVAAAGTGFFSQFHFDAWLRLPVDVVGVCDLDEARAGVVAGQFDGAGVFTDFEAMLDETSPDIVDIITPPPTHYAFVSAAARRGITAICQKPFCNSLEEAEKLVRLLQEKGALCVVHENFRFQPWYGELKKLIDEGAVGTPYQVAFRLRPGDGQGPQAYLDRQPYFQDMERFLVHETAIHWIDVFRFMFGEVSAVTARLTRFNPAIAGEDAGFIIFEFANGARGLFDGNRLADHAAENRRLTMGDMLIDGSGGAVQLNGDGEIFLRRSGSNQSAQHEYDWQDIGFGGDCVYRLQAHVLAHLTSGRTLWNSAEDYLTNLRIEEAVYRSAEEGITIKF